MRHLFVRVPVAALLALGVLLSGCGGDDEPAGDPTPIIASPTESSEPTESESAVAAETPEEFIKRFFAASDEMHLTGDSSKFRKFWLACKSCESIADEVDAIYGDGGEIRGVRWRVGDVKRTGSKFFKVALNVSPSQLRRTPGGEWERSVGGDVELSVHLGGDGSDRRVVGFTVLAQ